MYIMDKPDVVFWSMIASLTVPSSLPLLEKIMQCIGVGSGLGKEPSEDKQTEELEKQEEQD